MIRIFPFGFTLLCSYLMAHATPPAAGWLPIIWQDEKSLVSTSHGWKAIVSLERGRLMHFGPADREINLLLAPATRDNPDIWGGHRVWLGPQANWAKIWPPPQEWEVSGPATFTNADGTLRLLMGEAGDGWPRLTRIYRWEGTGLICGVELSGGTRQAQIIQIFQVPAATVVRVEAKPAEGFPVGYVRLPSAAGKYETDFAQPAQVTRAGSGLTLRHTPVIDKLGFFPQALDSQAGAFGLTVTRSTQTGRAVGAPDDGYFTQIYLGGPEALIELEQLSPLFAPGEPASFAVVLQGVAH